MEDNKMGMYILAIVAMVAVVCLIAIQKHASYSLADNTPTQDFAGQVTKANSCTACLNYCFTRYSPGDPKMSECRGFCGDTYGIDCPMS
jgi:hypothetical protein